MDYTGWLVNLAPNLTMLFVLLLIWSLIWKGIALWKAAHNNDKAWFIALLILNTIGILEIFYIFVFSKRNSEESKQSKPESKPETKQSDKK